MNLSTDLLAAPAGLQTFIPPQRCLLGPGPSEIDPRVLTAAGRPTIGYLDPAFVTMMEELKSLLRYAFQTANPVTFAASGPGSVGMEMCFVNLVEPGDKVIVCRNGVFGGRMIENVTRAGGIAVVVEDQWGQPVSPEKLQAALAANPDAAVVAFVHAETSTGVASDAATLCALAAQAGCLSIVDCVTSLAGIPVAVDAWGADAVYSGSQKCLSCVPGLAPITFSARAIERVKARKLPVRSWFMDLNLILGYWGETTRTYHHTAPNNSLFALHESLRLLAEEGLAASWARHRRLHEMLAEGLAPLGIEFLVEPAYRLPQLNALKVPEGADEAAVRRRLLVDFSIEIGAGLGPLAGKIWRIGLMGYSAREESVRRVLAALRELLAR
ncbi:MAG: alanine--glyoxylate aminotransferase family protein [Betaproteobacteria bacterium]|nr:alanine--glyoxylate aminotransferase family protein [Betaproteobacteria bacterium]